MSKLLGVGGWIRGIVAIYANDSDTTFCVSTKQNHAMFVWVWRGQFATLRAGSEWSGRVIPVVGPGTFVAVFFFGYPTAEPHRPNCKARTSARERRKGVVRAIIGLRAPFLCERLVSLPTLVNSRENGVVVPEGLPVTMLLYFGLEFREMPVIFER